MFESSNARLEYREFDFFLDVLEEFNKKGNELLIAACEERIDAFKKIGVKDPVYA